MPTRDPKFSHNHQPQTPPFYLGAIEAFGALVTKLESNQAHQMNLKELEDLGRRDGFEALRLALQSHVNERASYPHAGTDRRRIASFRARPASHTAPP